MAVRHILILGGTGDARQIAERLAERPELHVTLSLAGRTRAPLPQAGTVRVGGFGGAQGLAAYLSEHQVGMLIDATHPFAATMSANSTVAARSAGIPLIALDRPAWKQVEGDRWIDVDDVARAVDKLGEKPKTVFLTIGRQELAPFKAAPQHRYVVRSVDPVDAAVSLPDADYILDRGPFTEEGERRLLADRKIDIVVAKNSGGAATCGKIAAARALGILIVMVRRPPPSGAPTAASVEEVLAAVAHWLAAPAERGE